MTPGRMSDEQRRRLTAIDTLIFICVVCIGSLLGVIQGICNNALRPILLNYTIIALDPNTRWASRDVFQLFAAFQDKIII